MHVYGWSCLSWHVFFCGQDDMCGMHLSRASSKKFFWFELDKHRPRAAMNWAQVSFEDPDTLVEEGMGRPLCPRSPQLGPTQDPPLPTGFDFELPPQWVSVYVVAPRCIHPASLAAFGDRCRPYLPLHLCRELQNFLGWFLQLVVEGCAERWQFRRRLRLWQERLCFVCWPFQLSWTEAYTLYAVEILDI